MRLVFVTGTQEIDRKTIIGIALQRSGMKFGLTEFDEIYPIEKELAYSETTDEVKKVKTQFNEKLEKVMIGFLKEGKDLILNGSLTIKNQKLGFIPILHEKFFDMFRPECIVLFELVPKPGMKLKPEISEHQKVNRNFAVSYSSHSDSELKIISMYGNEILNAVKEVTPILKG